MGVGSGVLNLNTYLEQIRSRLTECYQELTVKKKLVTAVAVKNLFCGFEEKEHSLMTLFDYHNVEMKTTLEWGTLKNYFTTRRYVEEYLRAHLKTSDVFLSQLNYRFLTEFERFMKAYLTRAVSFHRLGEIRDKSYEDQRFRASGLTLVTAAIVLWNTVYLDRIITGMKEHGQQVYENLLQYLSPLGWEHINLTGDYVWQQNKQPKKGEFRPLKF